MWDFLKRTFGFGTADQALKNRGSATDAGVEFQTIPLRQVFTPGGQPSVTYVGREHLNLEDAVREPLIRGYSINVVTGPTKSGKTVLCRHVLSEIGPSCAIEGGQVRTEEDFWKQVASQLEIGNSFSREESGTRSDSAGYKIKGGIPAAVEGEVGQERSTSRTTTRTIEYEVALQPKVFKHMIEKNIPLLVDDFHYMPKAVQKSLIQSLKGAVFDGLPVILLAVPHRAFDPMTVEQEIEGRFTHVEIPPWDITDLIQIPEKGFAALNVEASSDLNRAICSEGFANPLLVQ